MIHLRKVEVNNLKSIALDLPLRKFIVFCGVSGSGKSSLAFDTLYAEGQRRYLASFSAYARQFLERLERPAAEIENIPAAIAVRGRQATRSDRATVGAATELYDHLRLLFAQLGRIECPGCGRTVVRDDAETAVAAIERIPAGAKLLVGFERPLAAEESTQEVAAALCEEGYVRAIAAGRMFDLTSPDVNAVSREPWLIVIDRLTVGAATQRLHDSLESAWRRGNDRCLVLTDAGDPAWGAPTSVDGRPFRRRAFSSRLVCEPCGREFLTPEPRLFSYNSPLGACPTCRGTGLASPSSRTSRKRPARSIDSAPDAAETQDVDATCTACEGGRLRAEALAVRLDHRNIAEWAALPADALLQRLAGLPLTDRDRGAARQPLEQIEARLSYLQRVGLGYLALDRPLRTLSDGEARRVSLTAALSSSLVNLLYVFDEPSAGLHPHDVHKLLAAIVALARRGNTLAVVEHDEAFLRAADWLVEIGPAAGERGGKVIFEGRPLDITGCSPSPTGDFLSGRRTLGRSAARRTPNRGRVQLVGARGHNLQNVTVEFPLGLLCVVTGPSGSGKSSLVIETLYPALARRMRKPQLAALPFDDVFGDGQLDDVLMVDQSPIGRSARSNPVTYLKAFDDIRALFAETITARTLNYGPGHFSFNLGEGRCPTCEGDGQLAIDMQFLADIYMRCPQCQGRRYRPEVLDVTYRGLSIADVLRLTVREAFGFFRGQAKLQGRLKALMDVGLDYLRLGQPANTLSGGEAQRMKLALHLAGARRGRTLFVLDEPTTGLHFADVDQLLDCFDSLLALGHSLVAVTHNLHLMRAADYIIDLGPGAAAAGGRVIATGAPEVIAAHPGSLTGACLRQSAGQ